MIDDKLFDELFPIGYWHLSYIKEPNVIDGVTPIVTDEDLPF